MTRVQAFHLGRVAAEEVLPHLEAALGSEHSLDLFKPFISEARDVLHSVCGHFEKDATAEKRQAQYLPLFDALSMLAQYLQSNQPRRELLVEARRVLLRLVEKGRAA